MSKFGSVPNLEIGMDVEKEFCMNGGSSESSYANSSSLQKRVSDAVRNITMESVQEACLATSPGSVGIADLGCSSGPNSLSIVRAMIDAVQDSSRRASAPVAEIRVYLNDLPANDFSSVFGSLPEFFREIGEGRGDLAFPQVFVAVCAGSFYGRLFPANSLHFVHSSSSLHWLSRVPAGVYDEQQGKSINRGNIYLSGTTPPPVSQAYLDQFRHDFRAFLQSRSEEVVTGGRMVLILLARPASDHLHRGETLLWKLLYRSMSVLVSQGEVEEEKLDSYDVPFYAPCEEEMEREVMDEGSFELCRSEMFQVSIQGDGVSRGTAVARAVRAIQEGLIRRHFGPAIDLDTLFERYGRMVDEELAMEDLEPYHLLLVLSKK